MEQHVKLRKVRFSLCNRIVHEGKIASRSLIKNGCSVEELTSRLNTLLKTSVTSASKWTLLLLATVALLSQEIAGEAIRIGTTLGLVSLPRIYVVAIGVAAWIAIIFRILPSIIYVFLRYDLRLKETDHRRFSSIRQHLSGDEFGDLTSPIRNSQLSEFYPLDTAVLLSLYFTVLLIGLFPLYASSFLIAMELLTLWRFNEYNLIEYSILISCSVLFWSTSVYTVLFFVPLPVRKNLSFIRWNFLYPINLNETGLHPSGSRWLDN